MTPEIAGICVCVYVHVIACRKKQETPSGWTLSRSLIYSLFIPLSEAGLLEDFGLFYHKINNILHLMYCLSVSNQPIL